MKLVGTWLLVDAAGVIQHVSPRAGREFGLSVGVRVLSSAPAAPRATVAQLTALRAEDVISIEPPAKPVTRETK